MVVRATAPTSAASACTAAVRCATATSSPSGGRTLTYTAPLASRGGSTVAGVRGPAPQLSAAQRRVLVALCRPLAAARFATPPSNRELAAELHLSVETVKFHLHALFELFGIEGLRQHQKRAALARLALERGVVGPRDVLRDA